MHPYRLLTPALQPWRLKATDGGGWLLRFRLGLACRLSFSGERGCRAAIEVTVEPPAAGVPALQSRMLQQLGGCLWLRCTLPDTCTVRGYARVLQATLLRPGKPEAWSRPCCMQLCMSGLLFGTASPPRQTQLPHSTSPIAMPPPAMKHSCHHARAARAAGRRAALPHAAARASPRPHGGARRARRPRVRRVPAARRRARRRGGGAAGAVVCGRGARRQGGGRPRARGPAGSPAQHR